MVTADIFGCHTLPGTCNFAIHKMRQERQVVAHVSSRSIVNTSLDHITHTHSYACPVYPYMYIGTMLQRKLKQV